MSDRFYFHGVDLTEMVSDLTYRTTPATLPKPGAHCKFCGMAITIIDRRLTCWPPPEGFARHSPDPMMRCRYCDREISRDGESLMWVDTAGGRMAYDASGAPHYHLPERPEAVTHAG